jgi:pyruvate-ferredoxin/flavodoxin oxidoreductase
MRVKLASAVDLTDANAVVRAVESTGQPRPDAVQPGQQAQCRQALATARPGLGEEHRAVAGEAQGPQVALRRRPDQRGRAEMGIVNSTGCTSVWGSTYPFHPYPFPWTSHLFQDSPSVAMGIFEGHMAKMADGFKAVRMAEKELAGDYLPDRDDDFFRRFTGSSSPPTSGSSARRWCRSAATARCMTSASRTCRAR